jgi:hypothetical protein
MFLPVAMTNANKMSVETGEFLALRGEFSCALVMAGLVPGLVPAIHDLLAGAAAKNVDASDKRRA